MNRGLVLVCFGLAALAGSAISTRAGASDPAPPGSDAPAFSGEKLVFPTDYRQWIYLSSGLGMTYSAGGGGGGAPMFDNVFVKPAAYRSFIEAGHWPDKTIFVLEQRESTDHGSILKGGRYQLDAMGYDVEVHDARFPDNPRFYTFGSSDGPIPAGDPVPKAAGCLACHTKNGAVDRTFVQFYPTLLTIAKAKGTLSASYQHNEAEAAATSKPQ